MSFCESSLPYPAGSEDMLRAGFRGRIRTRARKFYRIFYFLLAFSLEAFDVGLTESALSGDQFSALADRIALPPAFHFVLCSIAAWIASRMPRITKGLVLKQSRPPSRTGALDSLPGRLVDRDHVHTIHREAWNSVAGGTRGD